MMTELRTDAAVAGGRGRRRHRTGTAWALAALVLGCTLTGCRGRDEDDNGPARAPAPAPAEPGAPDRPAPVAPSPADIQEKPDDLIGKVVTISGEVNRILGPRVFTIGGEDFGNELLIVTTEPLPQVRERPAGQPLNKGDIVQVTGLLRKFVLAEVEKEIDTELAEAVFVEWERQPVVIASRVVVTPRTRASVHLRVPVSLEAIFKETKAFYGKTVTVHGPVKEVLSPAALTIASGPAGQQELLVVGQPAAFPPALKPGLAITATGKLRPFEVQKVEDELQANLEESRFKDWAEKPVLIVDSIEVTK